MTTPRPVRIRQEQPGHRSWEHLPDAFGSVDDISDALVCREQHQFLITDASGNVTHGNRRGLGLYSHDTRHLSVYEFLLDDIKPLVLLSTADSGFSQHQVLGNYRLRQGEHVIGRATIEIVRRRVLERFLDERVTITNYNNFPVTIEPGYFFDADFADVFEVRGHRRLTPGENPRPEVSNGSICYSYLGADGIWRRTLIVFDRPASTVTAHGARFRVTLGPRETFAYSLRIYTESGGRSTANDSRSDPPEDEAAARLAEDYARWRDSFAAVLSNNETYNLMLERAVRDMRMLWTRERHGESYLAAGIPWFATLFGRDSIIASLQTLPFRPHLARDTLAILARYQGQSFDAFREEAPGKILHELRDDELSSIGELPYQRYYGSVDSTPLFLLLAAEYFHWTGDLPFIQQLLPAINLALQWTENHGDLDGDGFIEYRTDSPGGLRNQGWKDSQDGIRHADGSLCEGPIALCEVQGYLYDAYLKLAPVLEALGESQRARRLRQRAEDLRERFNRAFWLADLKNVALALDGAKRPARVSSSNAGQVLWSGILPRDRAARVRNALLQPDMFSGWGVRTLSSQHRSYFPLGYHTGTVWPHDNGIIAMGLKRYGFDGDVTRLATALFEATQHFSHYRLPELFGGQARDELPRPVPYPVACRPQAWTAGAHFHFLQAMLGLRADAAARSLWLVRPQLPPWLEQLELRRIRVGEGEADIWLRREGQRTRVRYSTRGQLSVSVTADWRRFQPGLPPVPAVG